MSLEAHIEQLNSNILALIGALNSLGTAPVPGERPAAVSPAATKTAAAAPVPALDPPAEVIDFETMKKAVLKYAAVFGQAKGRELLKKYDAAKTADVPEGSWRQIHFEATAEIEAAGKA